MRFPWIVGKGFCDDLRRHASGPKRWFTDQAWPEFVELSRACQAERHRRPVHVGQPVSIHQAVFRVNVFAEVILAKTVR